MKTWNFFIGAWLDLGFSLVLAYSWLVCLSSWVGSLMSASSELATDNYEKRERKKSVFCVVFCIMWRAGPIRHLSDLYWNMQALPGTQITSSSSVTSVCVCVCAHERWKAAWWTQQRYCRCRTSSVNNMLTKLGWPPLQHRCRKARLVIFYKFHHSSIVCNNHSHQAEQPTIPVSGACHSYSLSYLVPYWPQEILFSQHNQGWEWPHWGCGGCTHPWDFPFTSSKINTLRVGPAPPVSSVDS